MMDKRKPIQLTCIVLLAQMSQNRNKEQVIPVYVQTFYPESQYFPCVIIQT